MARRRCCRVLIIRFPDAVKSGRSISIQRSELKSARRGLQLLSVPMQWASYRSNSSPRLPIGSRILRRMSGSCASILTPSTEHQAIRRGRVAVTRNGHATLPPAVGRSARRQGGRDRVGHRRRHRIFVKSTNVCCRGSRPKLNIRPSANPNRPVEC